MAKSPPHFSAHQVLNFVCGAVMMAVCIIAVLSRATTATKSGVAGDFGAYINGVSSPWLWTVNIIAASTAIRQPEILKPLEPLTCLIRRLALAFGACSVPASLLAWWQWHLITGFLDMFIATSTLCGCFLLGVLRDGWVCVLSSCFFYLTLVCVFAEQHLEQYQPLPHIVFRFTAILTGQAAINVGLEISLSQLVLLGLVCLCFDLSGLALEWWLLRCSKHDCSYLFRLGPYLAGTARTLLFVLVAMVLFFTCVLERKEESDTSSSSDEEDTEEESDSLKREQA